VKDVGFDSELARGVLELKFSGARVLAGFTTELWEHTETFPAVQKVMESYGWREKVNHATQRVTFGQRGWIDDAAWK